MEYLTKKQVANQMKISERRVDYLRSLGELPFLEYGQGKSLRFYTNRDPDGTAQGESLIRIDAEIFEQYITEAETAAGNDGGEMMGLTAREPQVDSSISPHHVLINKDSQKKLVISAPSYDLLQRAWAAWIFLQDDLSLPVETIATAGERIAALFEKMEEHCRNMKSVTRQQAGDVRRVLDDAKKC